MVEDNPGDVRLAEEAFKENGIPHKLYAVKDGFDALDFLKRDGSYAEAPRPDLILLDLNLPRKNGLEVLAIIKSDDELRQIPVVVLTTSDAEEDVRKAYNLYANCYIAKPIDLDEFFEVVKSIKEFWYRIAKLPPE